MAGFEVVYLISELTVTPVRYLTVRDTDASGD